MAHGGNEFIDNIQSTFLNDYFPNADIEMYSETTSLNSSELRLPKPQSRPKWYAEFFELVAEKRHKCKQCGWTEMSANHSLSNLIRHFHAEKSKGCKAKYNDWKNETERLQPKLSSVFKGEVSFDKLNKEAQTRLDTLLGNFIVFSEAPLRLV